MFCVCMCSKFHGHRMYNCWVMKCRFRMSYLYCIKWQKGFNLFKLLILVSYYRYVLLCDILKTTVRFQLMECFISCWIAAAPLVFQGFVLHQSFFTQRSHVNSSLSRMRTMKCEFWLIIIIDSINEFHVHVSYSQSVSELHTLFTRPAAGFLVG